MPIKVKDRIKHLYGWTTNRKIIVLSIDDFGNVRIESKKARESITEQGFPSRNRFDEYDALENSDDLEMLFNVLSGIKDVHGNHPSVSAFSVPCNINFEETEDSDYQQYYYETLPETYKKLESKFPVEYKKTWDLWKQGINEGLLSPQFHGREHYNVNMLVNEMRMNNKELLTALKNNSVTNISDPAKKLTQALFFEEKRELPEIENIITDGIEKFKVVFHAQAKHLGPPAGFYHPYLYPILKNSGVKYIDVPLLKRFKNLPFYRKTSINYIGKKNKFGIHFIVRNVVFEPTDLTRNNWVEYTIKQIETAFRFKKPAIISSHRVNFVGQIDPRNRNVGLEQMQRLLETIKKKWPDAEFLMIGQLDSLIT